MIYCDVDAPPPWYDNGATPVHEVQFVTQEWLQQYTQRPDIEFCGWTEVTSNPQKIYIVTDMSDADKVKVLRHELGHVRGWRHRDSNLARLIKKLKSYVR